ncbi:MAG: hypothetical protein ACO3A4_06605 [Silvanigrellaceae bacterium]
MIPVSDNHSCASTILKPPGMPRRVKELLLFLEKSPSGLASTQLSVALHGEARMSAHAPDISRARLEATRKLIQRTKHRLDQNNSNWRLEYCKKLRVWRTIKIALKNPQPQ